MFGFANYEVKIHVEYVKAEAFRKNSIPGFLQTCELKLT